MIDPQPGAQTGVDRATVRYHRYAALVVHPGQDFVHGCPDAGHESGFAFLPGQWVPGPVNFPGGSNFRKAVHDFVGRQAVERAKVVFLEARIEADRQIQGSADDPGSFGGALQGAGDQFVDGSFSAPASAPSQGQVSACLRIRAGKLRQPGRKLMRLLSSLLGERIVALALDASLQVTL